MVLFSGHFVYPILKYQGESIRRFRRFKSHGRRCVRQ